MRNAFLEADLKSAEKRLKAQTKSVDADKAFIADKKLVADLPATASAVAVRLDRNMKQLELTKALVAELRKVLGGAQLST